jgi:guanylate kinase
MYDDKLLVIIGPSGVGKSSIVRTLQAQQLVRNIPSWTTRPPRPDEQTDEQIDHVFVSEEDFLARAKQSFFLEYEKLFGLPYYYGLPRITPDPARPDTLPVVLLRVPLIPLLQKHYHNFVIYQIEDSYERASARLAKRAVDGEAQGERLDNFSAELAAGRQLAARVFYNDSTVQALTQQIASAIAVDFAL